MASYTSEVGILATLITGASLKVILIINRHWICKRDVFPGNGMLTPEFYYTCTESYTASIIGTGNFESTK